MKYKILFVCLGNICRSASAEEIMRTLLKKEGLENEIRVDSAGISGYHEGDLPDALLKRIIDRYMLPAFRQQDWDAGMLAGLTAICEVLQGRTPADLTQSQGGNGAWLELLFFLGLPLLIIGLGWYNARRCPKCHKRALKRTDTRLISDTGIRSAKVRIK